MANNWVHRLEWYEIESMQGECGECGIVPITAKKSGGYITYRCSIAIKEQRGDRRKYPRGDHKYFQYKNSDGTITYLKKAKRDSIMDSFGDKCQICKKESDSLKLDHCHSKKEFRGVLCNSCNVGLGAFKDNPTSLQAAIDYLARTV